MKRLLGVFALLCAQNLWAGPTLIQIDKCLRSNANEEILRRSEFSWGVSLTEIKAKEKDIYDRGLRLKERAYLENGKVYLPHTPYGSGEQKIHLSERFLQSVIKHVEVGFKRGYIDALIFPDMGHSHLFIDKAYYESTLSSIPVKEGHRRYELMLNHPKTRFLYHTAEQLKMLDDNKKLLDDRKVQWRFFTRNLIGSNEANGRLEILHNEGHSHNTARSYEEGFRYWGAGFTISGSKNGCFAYQREGKTFYFDLSLKALEP